MALFLGTDVINEKSLQDKTNLVSRWHNKQAWLVMVVINKPG
jgi:hypothetical protein